MSELSGLCLAREGGGGGGGVGGVLGLGGSGGGGGGAGSGILCMKIKVSANEFNDFMQVISLSISLSLSLSHTHTHTYTYMHPRTCINAKGLNILHYICFISKNVG